MSALTPHKLPRVTITSCSTRSHFQRPLASRLWSRRRGGALVLTMIFVTLFSMISGYVMLAANNQMRNTHRARLFSTSLAAAATIVNSMTQQAYFVATTRPAQVGGNFDQLDSIIKTIDPSPIPGYVSVAHGSDDLTFFQANGTNGSYATIDDPDDDWNGFSIRRWRYKAVAFENAANPADPQEVDPTAKRLGFRGAGFSSNLEINFIPLFQYAIFYDNDLELHTGPDMDVNGPVHSNKTLWVATKGTLNFKDRVSAAGKFRTYRDFVGVDGSTLAPVNKDNAKLEVTDHAGNVTVVDLDSGDQNQANNNIPSSMDTNANTYLDHLDANWLSDAIERWHGGLQDSAMGIKTIRPPLPYIEKDGEHVQANAGDLIQRASSSDSPSMKDSKMEYKADYIIEGDPTKTKWVEDDGDGHEELTDIKITRKSDGTEIPNKQGNTYIVTPGAFHDNRQEKVVNTFDVNMGEMIDRGLTFSNGLLYVSTDDGNQSEMPAVRIINASKVPTNSMHNTFTIATDRPMYLEGDVNSGSESTRAALLLAADAITVTSQKLTLDNTADNSYPSASDTVTNAIFMLGQVASTYDDGSDHYVPGTQRQTMSGGAHNVLRYLENWGGKTHTFNGSLICLFESRIATAPFWRMDGNTHVSYYSPPKRQYNWDANLRHSEPPCGMPLLVEVKISPLTRISEQEAVASLN